MGTVLICLLAAPFEETGLLKADFSIWPASVEGLPTFCRIFLFGKPWDFIVLTLSPNEGTESWTWRGHGRERTVYRRMLKILEKNLLVSLFCPN